MHFYNKIAKVFSFFSFFLFFFFSWIQYSPGQCCNSDSHGSLLQPCWSCDPRHQSPVKPSRAAALAAFRPTTVSTLSPSLNAPPSSSLLEVYILQFEVEYAVLNNLMYMLSFCFIILRVSLSSLSNKNNILFIMFASLSRDFS